MQKIKELFVHFYSSLNLDKVDEEEYLYIVNLLDYITLGQITLTKDNVNLIKEQIECVRQVLKNSTFDLICNYSNLVLETKCTK